jgi:hypothetical protein
MGQTFGDKATSTAFFSSALPVQESYPNSELLVDFAANKGQNIALNGLEYTVNNGSNWLKLNPSTTITGGESHLFRIPGAALGNLVNVRQISGSTVYVPLCNVHHYKPPLKT